MKFRSIFLPVLVLIFGAFFSGCATLTSGDQRSQFIANVAIQTATMKFIEGSSEPALYASKSIEIAKKIKSYVASSELIPIADVMRELNRYVPYNDMKQSDAVLATSLIQLISMELDARAGENQLDPNLKVAVNKLADIVMTAAGYYVP